MRAKAVASGWSILAQDNTSSNRYAREVADFVWDPGWATRVPIVASPIVRQNPVDNKTVDNEPDSEKPAGGAVATCFQDPRGAIGNRHQPPKRNKNPVCHLLSPAPAGSCGQFQNPSNTRNTLVSRHPRGLPKAPQFSCFFSEIEHQTLF